MLYSLYIKIDNVYTLFNPNLESCIIKKSIVDGQIFARTTVEGELFFKGNDYDILYTQLASYNKLDAYITVEDGSNIVGFINLLGRYSVLEATCNLQFVVVDEYTKLIDAYDTAISFPVDNVSPLLINRTCHYESLDFEILGLTTKYYGRGLYKLKNVIQWLVQYLDPTIQFNSASFDYLNNTGYQNVYFATIDNFLRVATESIATFEISLSKLMNIFNIMPFNMFWKLDLIGGQYYFKLVHASEINYTLGTVDLTNYKGVNWSKDKANFDYTKEARWYRLFRNTPILSTSLDFNGVDIYITSLQNLELNKTVEVNVITDIADCLKTNKSKYEDLGSDFYVLSMTGLTDAIYKTSADTQWNLKLVEIAILHGVNIGTVTLDNPTIGGVDVRLLVDVPNGAILTIKPWSDTSNFNAFLPLPSGLEMILDLEFYNPGGYTFPTSVEIYYVDDLTGVRAYPQESITLTDFGTVDLTYFTNNNSNEIPTGLVMFIKGTLQQGFQLRSKKAGDRLHYGYFKHKVGIAGTGLLEPTKTLENEALSISRLDDTFMKDKLPDTPAVINGVSTAVTVNKKFKSDSIKFPLHYPDLINFEKLIKTDLGNIEPKDLNIRMDGSMADITGNF